MNTLIQKRGKILDIRDVLYNRTVVIILILFYVSNLLLKKSISTLFERAIF
jgi:hypothetical protein